MSDNQKSLKGRTLYIHPMTQSSARLLAAIFRSTGIDARITPQSDERTLGLGAQYTSGDECLPQKVTLGDYLKITEQPGFDPAKTALLMPTATGPCRFGQYWPFLENVLRKKELDDILVLSPSSKTGYEGLAMSGFDFYRRAWIGVLAADIMRKKLLATRPYERSSGDADRVYEEGLQDLERRLETPDLDMKKLVASVESSLVASRDRFRAIDADYSEARPLIAVVGEIFCRHNRFSNDDMLRRIEAQGGETWISDLGEWVLYTDWSRKDKLRQLGRRFSREYLVTSIKQRVMHHYEHRLYRHFTDDFRGCEEPSGTAELVEYGADYLPAWGALGEMSLSLAKAGYAYSKGADGIVDISPFSCMNGIVSEAVYPSFSEDHEHIPCRVFYFDGSSTDVDRDLEIFMELVRNYGRRKRVTRRVPAHFGRAE